MNRVSFTFALSVAILVGVVASFAEDESSTKQRQSVVKFYGVEVDRKTHDVTFHFYDTSKKGDSAIRNVKAPRDISDVIAGPLNDVLETMAAVQNYPKDLEITASQTADLEKAFAQCKLTLVQIGESLRTESKPSVSKLAKDYAKSVERAKGDVLLDFQLKRLSQIKYAQMWFGSITQEGLLNALQAKEMRETFSITDAQIEEMKERKIALENEFDAEISALRRKYRKEFLGELTDVQRNMLDDLIGATPEPKSGSSGMSYLEIMKFDLLRF